MLTRNHKAYEWTGTEPPPTKTVYQAEDAFISQGVVESNWAGFTGTGFVNLDNLSRCERDGDQIRIDGQVVTISLEAKIKPTQGINKSVFQRPISMMSVSGFRR